MDSAVIAAFIAAGISMINNIIVNYINIRKDSNIKVIVETRIKYMQTLRGANATFIGMANPDVVLQCAKINAGLFVYPKELAKSAGLLKTLLKPFYPIESRLIEKINFIENKCLALFTNGEDDSLAETIKTELAIYIKLFAQYDWAYWLYIIRQADGRRRNSDKDFDKIYDEVQSNYKKDYNYDWENI